MSEEITGVDGFHEYWIPEHDGGNISRHEYLEWKLSVKSRIARRLKDITCRTEDELFEFLISRDWKWELVGSEIKLITPYYMAFNYGSYEEAVELELWSQEFARFRQNKMEEAAKNVQATRNCIIDRG